MIEAPERTQFETIRAEGGQIIDKVKELIHEGNVRRIVVKQDDDVVVEFPLTVGVIGVVLAPALAAIGAATALITNCTIEVEREATPPVPDADPVADATDEIG